MTRRAHPRRGGRVIPWTPAEEQELIDQIGKNPTNLTAAFLAASLNLTRTPGACSGHWYTKMANRDDVVAKLTIGNGVVVKNKTAKITEDSPHRKTILRTMWEAVLRILY